MRDILVFHFLLAVKQLVLNFTTFFCTGLTRQVIYNYFSPHYVLT